MDSLTNNYLDQLMTLIKDLFDSVGTQSSASVKSDVETLQTQLSNEFISQPED